MLFLGVLGSFLGGVLGSLFAGVLASFFWLASFFGGFWLASFLGGFGKFLRCFRVFWTKMGCFGVFLLGCFGKALRFI